MIWLFRCLFFCLFRFKYHYMILIWHQVKTRVSEWTAKLVIVFAHPFWGPIVLNHTYIESETERESMLYVKFVSMGVSNIWEPQINPFSIVFPPFWWAFLHIKHHPSNFPSNLGQTLTTVVCYKVGLVTIVINGVFSARVISPLFSGSYGPPTYSFLDGTHLVGTHHLGF